MGLRIRQMPSRKVRVVIVVIAAFALVVQPMYGPASSRIANAISVTPTTPSQATIAIEAPSVPTNGTPNNASVPTNDFYFNWDASTDNQPATITYEFQLSSSGAVDTDGSLKNAWNSLESTNSEQNDLKLPKIHSFGAPDGVYYWQVRAFDAAGNKSAWSQVWKMSIDKMTVDRAIPVATIDSYGVLNGKLSVKVHGTDDLSGVARIDANLYNEANQDPAVVSIKSQDYTSHNWSEYLEMSNVDVSSLPTGMYTIRAAVRDSAGNLSEYALQKVFIDNTSPVVTPPAPTITINQIMTDRTVTGTVSTVDATFKIMIDGTSRSDITPEVSSTVNASGTYDWSFVLPSYVLNGKEHTVDIIATANDQDSTLASVKFTLGADSPVPGGGSGVITQPSEDPLLEQLSNRLAQPFNVPSTFGNVIVIPATAGTGSTPTSVDQSVLGTRDLKDPAADQNAKLAAVPTESGWQLFGVAWYWWTLIIVAIALIMWRMITPARRADQLA